METPRINWRRLLIVIIGVLLTIALAIAEVTASHVNSPAGDPAAPWTIHVQQMDDALAKKTVRDAVRAWQEAYVAALGSRRWDGLVEGGDAYLRIGEVAGRRKAFEPTVRRIYLTALFRARQQGSLDGVLRTAEAFAALGDLEAAAQGIRIAEQLAVGVQAHERVRAVAARLATRFPETTSTASGPFEAVITP